MPQAKAQRRAYSVRTLAIISLIGVALGYSVLGMNSRLLSQGFEPATQVYVRILLGFGLSVLLFGRQLRFKRLLAIPKRDIFWLMMMGVVGYAGTVLTITLAVLNAKLVNASVISATAPFVVVIYSYFLLKEKIRPKLLVNLLLAVYGVAVVAAKSLVPALGDFGVGELFAIASVLMIGSYSVGRRMLSDHLNNKEITVLVMFIAGITSLLIALIKGEALHLQSFTLPSVWIGLTIGAGLNLGLTHLENFAWKNINLVFGNQLLMTSTVFSLIAGALFYKEFISLPEIIGGMIILATVWQANKLVIGTN